MNVLSSGVYHSDRHRRFSSLGFFVLPVADRLRVFILSRQSWHPLRRDNLLLLSKECAFAEDNMARTDFEAAEEDGGLSDEEHRQSVSSN